MESIKAFLDQMWVKVICVIAWVISTAILLFDGVTVGQLNDTAKLIVGVGSALALLIVGIRALLQKKDSTKK